MQKIRLNKTQTTSRSLSHLLLLHTNTRGEVSSGLEAAIKIAGARPSARIISPRFSGIEAGALLISGKTTRVLWSSDARLGQLWPLAEKLAASWIANWDGFAETENTKLGDACDPTTTLSQTENSPFARYP